MRTFSLLVVLSLFFAPLFVAADQAGAPLNPSEKLGWCLGVQAWSFNRYTFFESLDKSKAIGLKYIEAFPGQTVCKDMPDAKMGPGLTISQMATIKNKLDECGVTLVAFGVCHLSSNEKQAREIFDFAKVMGIKVLTSEPEQKDLPFLDKLASEYNIKIALHNHPKPSRYWNPDIVLEAVKGCSKMVGSCADTGHWVRSGLDPQRCLDKLSGRVVSFHLKDLNKKGNGHDVPWGTGVCDVAEIMNIMKKQGFKGPVSIEYEHNWTTSVPEIKQCEKFFEKQAKTLVK